jgi:hypothetical protein
MLVLSALKKFDLVTTVDGRVVPTGRAIQILDHPEGDARRQGAIQDAALSPDLYRELSGQYAQTGIPPNDDTLASEVIAAKGFNQAAVGGFVRNFRQTLQFAGITTATGVRSEVGESTQVKIGDYVQWESLGVLQFAEPRRVRKIYDGKWAQVEGSETGVLISDLTVEEEIARNVVES